MFTHDFNVYETLAKLDGLLESGHDDPSPMDRAEYQVHTDKLVHGAVELLRHLAMHDVLALETADSIETIKQNQVSALAVEADGAFSDEVVGIGLPPHLVPYGAIVDAMKAWNVGTVETTADLAVLAHSWREYLVADEAVDEPVFQAWASRASAISSRLLPSVERLVASGLLEIHDARTDEVMYPSATTIGSTKLSIIVHVASRSAPLPQSRSRPRKKSSSRSKRTRR